MSQHPWFTSALRWRTTLDDAIADAQAANQRLMLVVGRATCGGTRALVERTLAKEELEEFTREKFTLVAADADSLEPRVREIVDALPVKAPTPLIVYLSLDGRVLSSTAGGRPPAVLLNDMLGATTKK
ncbi:MAG TPA: thioredoxin family protein [Polyangia bacterium]|nr:thioredoxin family protein [Polyangia bacterium]